LLKQHQQRNTRK